MVIIYNEDKTKSVTIRPNQLEHFNRLDNIILENHCYIDLSIMGCGKSWMVAGLALKYSLPIGVLCPKSAESVWRDVCQQSGVKLLFIISYQSLRTQSGHQPKHGLLERFDSDNGTYFTPTDEFMRLAREGLFLVLDEFQNIKNNNDQYKACKALTTACLMVKGSSRFALLSGSPFDKEEHVINTLRLAGYIQHPMLYRYFKETAELKLYGAQELIDICTNIDAKTTQNLLDTFPLDYRSVPTLCYQLYVRVLKPRISSSMPPPPIEAEIDIKNGYYIMDPDDTESLIQAIVELSRAARFNPRTLAYDSRNASWGAITTALMHIETYKLKTFARLARKKLEENTNCKVIIFLNYVSSIKYLQEQLSDFKPLIMYGVTNQRDRGKIVHSFQTDKDKRLLIANLKVGGVSISLDDKIGDELRYTFISPSYSILDLHQATRRTYRDGTKSKSTIRFVYGKVGSRETSILNALARKNRVLKETLDTQVEHGIKFPGEYEDDIEDDPTNPEDKDYTNYIDTETMKHDIFEPNIDFSKLNINPL